MFQVHPLYNDNILNMNYANKEKSRSEYISRINRVVDHIKNNINSDLSLEQLAGVAAFSKYYFHKIFKSISGENINSYVNRIRIEKSAFLLKHNQTNTITSISYDCGFSSPAVYSRTFKSYYKVSPTQWRESNSKNCKVVSNIGQFKNKNGEDLGNVTMYIDSRTKKPLWRIKMKDDKQIEVEVRDMPKINIAYIRHNGAYDPHDKKLFQTLFSKLMRWAIPRGLFTPPETQAMTAYSSGHPDTTASENLAVDVCISINKDTNVTGEIGKRTISGGQYAVVSLTNATMEQCSESWDKLFNSWLPQSGFQPGEGGYYCNHLNDPEQHPQKLHDVEMYLPVKPLQ
ncbi:MAG: AraC family transcriptional regulator [Methylococcales bacterium]